MTETSHSHFGTALRVAFFALLALLVILCGLLFHQYRILRDESFMPGHPHFFGSHGARLSDTSLIQSWMTYDYISHVYGLPIDYLKTTLTIADPSYPRITISESAEAQHENATALTDQVRAAVAHYLVTPGT
jgi:hypothetical protein